MSHLIERKDKNCLNCNAIIHGRFCHICGQENVETKESFWHLATHFIYDIFHFDGKFATTLKYLLFKPGFLTKEYIYGRRTAYLHPIRMYIFTSAFFFLIFFSFYSKNAPIKIKSPQFENNDSANTVEQMNEKFFKYRDSLKFDLADTNNEYIKSEIEQKNQLITTDSLLLKLDTTYKSEINFKNYKLRNPNVISFNWAKKYRDVKQYDSIQNQLPKTKRDNFFKKFGHHTNLSFKEASIGKSNKEVFNIMLDAFLHKIPQLLFTSLPFFAFALFVLFARKRQYYFTNHVVFSLHLYCGIFIIILLQLWLKSICTYLHINTSVSGVLTILQVVFWYKSFRNFYGQSRFKTIVKQFILLFINIIIATLLLTIFIFIVVVNFH